MTPMRREHTLAEHYDQTLRLARVKPLPAGQPGPQPTCYWPPENIEFYERYRDFLLSGGASELSSKLIYLTVAGHALGLNLKPHGELDLEGDLERVMEYVQAREYGRDWVNVTRNALNRFRRFLRLERGLGELTEAKPFDLAGHTAGLPAWLVSELERYQHVQQRNWRAARLDSQIRSFWNKHTKLWYFLVRERGVQQLADVKRQDVLGYVDRRLADGRAVTGVNSELHIFRSFLLFLQDEGYDVPQALLRIPGLKQPDSLPKHFTDEQVKALRDEIERDAREAKSNTRRRDALMERALFYLLWHGAMRLGELEELRLEDLDILGRKVTVRNGKGMKDRTVYLSDTAIGALREYLVVRGMGRGDHVFLYRNVPFKRGLVHSRMKSVGDKVGVHTYCHRFRHTGATQLLEAGCRITSLQRFLGHKRLDTTLIYARVHDHSVAEDYFAAMRRVERRLDIVPPEPASETNAETVPMYLEVTQLLVWAERLAVPELGQKERLEIAEQIKFALSSSYISKLSPPVLAA